MCLLVGFWYDADELYRSTTGGLGGERRDIVGYWMNSFSVSQFSTSTLLVYHQFVMLFPDVCKYRLPSGVHNGPNQQVAYQVVLVMVRDYNIIAIMLYWLGIGRVCLLILSLINVLQFVYIVPIYLVYKFFSNNIAIGFIPATRTPYLLTETIYNTAAMPN